LIDFYRKSDKNNALWIKMTRLGYRFSISIITKYEIYCGAKPEQRAFWDSVLRHVDILTLDEICIDTAVLLNTDLKQKNKRIELADLLIAATAVSNELPLLTFNNKHFSRVTSLEIFEIQSF
jgi:tRNA(fMet)-specific endonuclease VapC